MAFIFSAFPLIGWGKLVSEVLIDINISSWGDEYYSSTIFHNTIFIQSYFMGCVFDLFSTSLNTRSYVAVMFIIAWFIPLITITACYIGILLRVWYCPNRKFLLQGKSSGCPSNDQANGFGVMNRINGTLHGTSPGHTNDMSRYVKRVILSFTYDTCVIEIIIFIGTQDTNLHPFNS